MVVLGAIALAALAGLAAVVPPDAGSRLREAILEPCPLPATHDRDVARTVHAVGTDRGVSDKVMLSAFAAGWIESRLHNLPCGDRDSVGVFQQRPSQDWGSPDQLMDVEYAAAQYFAVAERTAAQQPHLTAGELAQSVQRSAFPERYDEALGKARELLAETERQTATP